MQLLLANQPNAKLRDILYNNPALDGVRILSGDRLISNRAEAMRSTMDRTDLVLYHLPAGEVVGVGACWLFGLAVGCNKPIYIILDNADMIYTLPLHGSEVVFSGPDAVTRAIEYLVEFKADMEGTVV